MLQETAVKGIVVLKLQMEDTGIHEQDLKYQISNTSYESQIKLDKNKRSRLLYDAGIV